MKNCKHNFELISKKYDFYNDLESFFIFCHLCGEVRKVEIEGDKIYISISKKGGENGRIKSKS